MVLGERDLCSRPASFSIDYNGKIIKIKRKRNSKSLSPSTINYYKCGPLKTLTESSDVVIKLNKATPSNFHVNTRVCQLVLIFETKTKRAI